MKKYHFKKHLSLGKVTVVHLEPVEMFNSTPAAAVPPKQLATPAMKPVPPIPG